MGKTIKAQKLTPEAFAKYGSYNDLLHPGDWPKLGDDDSDVKFFRDMALGSFQPAGSIAFSNTQVKKRPMEIGVIEKHNETCEGMLVLDNPCIVFLGAATPEGEYPYNDLEAFIVPKGVFLVIRPGVWHHAPFVIDADVANTLIVLPEYTYVNDCVVYDVPREERPVIEV